MISRYSKHPMEQNFLEWDQRKKAEARALNIFIAERYDELAKEAKHGHYEILFRLVRDAMHFVRQRQEEDKPQQG